VTTSSGWQRVTWVAGLIVAACAGVATAHGLYEVARTAGQPRAIAWLYPVATDGLALVAYAVTARLTVHARRYAAAIVILAAGLSGLAQAVQLVGGLDHVPPAEVRFGVGAWPAVAFLLAVHLVHLSRRPEPAPVVLPAIVEQARPGQDTDQANEQDRAGQATGPGQDKPAGDVARAGTGRERQARQARTVGRHDVPPNALDPQDRARQYIEQHRADQHQWPTVRDVASSASVSRETAGKILRQCKAASTTPVESNGHNATPPRQLVQP
jgi:hypothetical protein